MSQSDKRIFERETWPPIGHLGLTVAPEKHGSGRAKLNSRRLFASESRGDT